MNTGIWYIDVDINNKSYIRNDFFADGDKPTLTKRYAFYLLQNLIISNEIDVNEFEHITMTVEIYNQNNGFKMNNTKKTYKLF